MTCSQSPSFRSIGTPLHGKHTSPVARPGKWLLDRHFDGTLSFLLHKRDQRPPAFGAWSGGGREAGVHFLSRGLSWKFERGWEDVGTERGEDREEREEREKKEFRHVQTFHGTVASKESTAKTICPFQFFTPNVTTHQIRFISWWKLLTCSSSNWQYKITRNIDLLYVSDCE